MLGVTGLAFGDPWQATMNGVDIQPILLNFKMAILTSRIGHTVNGCMTVRTLPFQFSVRFDTSQHRVFRFHIG
jgi:hypothetical protein